MSKLLYIQASPRGKRSYSIAVADAFIEAYKLQHPDDKIAVLNVFKARIPDFDGLAVQAKYTILHGQAHSKGELKAWRSVERVINQFKAADKYLLAVPMWNFGIPYRLKQYIDILVQPGYTFTYNKDVGYQGLVKGKPAMVVYARGGSYPAGTPAEAYDLQKKYIELILGFIGFENIQSMVIEPTLENGPDVAATKRQQAIEMVKKMATDF
jgi:FMN-dependent NADH-azoreductase